MTQSLGILYVPCIQKEYKFLFQFRVLAMFLKTFIELILFNLFKRKQLLKIMQEQENNFFSTYKIKSFVLR